MITVIVYLCQENELIRLFTADVDLCIFNGNNEQTAVKPTWQPSRFHPHTFTGTKHFLLIQVTVTSFHCTQCIRIRNMAATI